MNLNHALENVQADRLEAIRFIQQQLPNDPQAQAAIYLTDDQLAELYVDAYQRSEWGI